MIPWCVSSTLLATKVVTSYTLLFRSAEQENVEVPFTQEEFRKRILGWVVCEHQPFLTIENPKLRWVFDLFKPKPVVPSASTIKNEIVKGYQEEQARIRDLLCSADRKVSITLDCWTSPNTKAFMGITVHYIDDSWTLQSHILDFVPLYEEHTGKKLCGAFVASCDRFGILPKILGITTDNASNMNTLFAYLEGVCRDRGIVFEKKEQRVRCMAHVTNLSVQALLRGLKAQAPRDTNTNNTPTPASTDTNRTRTHPPKSRRRHANLQGPILPTLTHPPKPRGCHGCPSSAVSFPAHAILLSVKTSSSICVVDMASRSRSPSSMCAHAGIPPMP